MAGANTVEFNDADFETDVLQADKPVLVDFWAPWCMPCKALGPTIDEIATEYAGKAKVGKLNTDSNQEMPVKYGIQAIPSVLIFKGGEVVQKFTGLASKKELQAALDRAAEKV
jgi:thioredoxin 1